MLSKIEVLLEDILKELKLQNNTHKKIQVDLDLDDLDMALFERLRDCRYTMSRSNKVPIYLAGSNILLASIAEKKPLTVKELLNISGFGVKMARTYGDGYLQTVIGFLEDQLLD